MWTQEVIKSLIMVAVSLSGYGVPKDTVRVVFEPHAVIAADACPGLAPEECTVLGYVRSDEPHTMIVDDRATADNIFSQSIIVHEAVHILQHDYTPVDIDGHVTCLESALMEIEAYHVSNQFLAGEGEKPLLVNAQSLGCTND